LRERAYAERDGAELPEPAETVDTTRDR
jgi:hypothetical protein